MPSWLTPTEEQIEAALQRMRSPDFESYFFARLENPQWIVPLATRGIFSNPPRPIVADGGRTMFPIWPATKYLVRMASQAPGEVASALDGIDVSNPNVAGDVVQASLAMPVEIASTMVPAIVRAAQVGTMEFHLEEAAGLCTRLAEEGEAAAALTLAEGLFHPVLDGDSGGPARRDAHSYLKALNQVVRPLARIRTKPFLQAVCRWLTVALEASEHVDRESGEDHSFLWRQAIEEHTQNRESDFAGNLAGCVREAFEVAIRDGAASLGDALLVLEPTPYLIFRRLRVHLINVFADQDPELARSTMMDSDIFDDFRFKHEYAMLMGRRLDLLTAEERAGWFEWVRSGPKEADLAELEGEDSTRREDYWRFSRLHWVREHLEGSDRAFYESMLDAHGEPELADLHMYTSAGSWGSKSPVAVEDFANRSLEAVVDFLTSWRPDPRQFLGPDINGLATTFEEYVATAPETLSRQATVLKECPSVYVRGFLNQMTLAVKTGKDIELGPVLALSEWVLSRPRDEPSIQVEGPDPLIDKDWQWTRDQISGLIKVVCEARENELPKYEMESLRAELWTLLFVLYADPSRSYIVDQEESEDPRAKDYLTLGINSPRGKAVEACLSYARWVADHVKREVDGHETVPGGFASMPEVKEMLVWQLEPENRSFEALAVIGFHLGLLFWVDRQWLADNADRVFDLRGLAGSAPRPHGWAAWNSFLVWVKPHIEFYRIFEEHFAYAVDQSARMKSDEPSREGPMEHLGEHLMVLYARGQLSLQEGSIVWRFITHTSSSVRRHAIGFLGRILWRDEALPSDVVKRLIALWEHYWAGPGAEDAREQPDAWLFGVWFASRQLPERWALRQLAAFVEVVPIPEPDHAVAKRLAEIAAVDVSRAVRIIDKMIHGDRQGWQIHGWRDSARKVLGLALEAGGDARQLAKGTLDYLGRRGYPDFGAAFRR
jgi:hypothetical protein